MTRAAILLLALTAALTSVVFAGHGSAPGWWKPWGHDGQLTVGKFNGADNSVKSSPPAPDQPFQWTRSATLTGNQASELSFDVSAGKDAADDFRLVVTVNRQIVYDRVIHGTTWQAIRIELAGGEGRTVPIAVQGHGGTAYWDNARIDPEPQQ